MTLAVLSLAALVVQASDPPADLASNPPVPVIRDADRILFVGDQMTQQMFYTRAVAAGLLAVSPDAGLRIFNGGRDDATADSAMGWIDDLLELTNPTVVSIALGFNEALAAGADPQAAARFEQDLSRLLDRILAYQGVRAVLVVGPIPSQPAAADETEPTGENQVLRSFSQAAARVAQKKNLPFVDLFNHMYPVLIEANRVGGEPLTIGGRIPTEVAHTVIASAVLHGLGVSAEQLDRVGWSPLRPVDMHRVRQVLALELQPPDLDGAARSRALYQSLQRFDELFFRLWRLSRADRPGRSRQSQSAAVEEAWSTVSALALSEYGRSASAK